MTRKDYIAVAEVVRRSKLEAAMFNLSSDVAMDALVDRLCTMFKADNANFNAETFKAACSDL